MGNCDTVAQCEARWVMCGNNLGGVQWLKRWSCTGCHKYDFSPPGQGSICLDLARDQFVFTWPGINLSWPGQGSICLHLAKFGILSSDYCHTPSYRVACICFRLCKVCNPLYIYVYVCTVCTECRMVSYTKAAYVHTYVCCICITICI